MIPRGEILARVVIIGRDGVSAAFLDTTFFGKYQGEVCVCEFLKVAQLAPFIHSKLSQCQLIIQLSYAGFMMNNPSAGLLAKSESDVPSCLSLPSFRPIPRPVRAMGHTLTQLEKQVSIAQAIRVAQFSDILGMHLLPFKTVVWELRLMDGEASSPPFSLMDHSWHLSCCLNSNEGISLHLCLLDECPGKIDVHILFKVTVSGGRGGDFFKSRIAKFMRGTTSIGFLNFCEWAVMKVGMKVKIQAFITVMK